MEKIIEKYIDYMKDKYNIIGAMITGSYVTKTMKPSSDIDIFFLGSDPEKSIRGRETSWVWNLSILYHQNGNIIIASIPI